MACLPLQTPMQLLGNFNALNEVQPIVDLIQGSDLQMPFVGVIKYSMSEGRIITSHVRIPSDYTSSSTRSGELDGLRTDMESLGHVIHPFSRAHPSCLCRF